MQLDIVEAEDSFDQANLCNIDKVRPERPRADVKAEFSDFCKKYKTDTVITYCTGCQHSLDVCGVKSMHLLDLITKNLA